MTLSIEVSDLQLRYHSRIRRAGRSGFLLESAAYGALGWPQQLSDQRLFTSAGEFGLIFLTFWVLLLLWTTAGALLAAAFYRSDEWGLFAIPLAVLLVLAAGVSVGYSAVPFVGNVIDVTDISLAVTVGLGGGAFLLGLASTWAAVRDIPVRN